MTLFVMIALFCLLIVIQGVMAIMMAAGMMLSLAVIFNQYERGR